MIGRYAKAAGSFVRMDERAWERHASPWSVWTRVAAWPVLMLVLWSFHWLGAWALLPFAVVAGWLAVNPRAFPPPPSTDHWASKATFGERVWLARSERPIPAHHARVAMALVAISTVATVAMLLALFLKAAALYVAAGAAVVAAKLWFCDRMVWLYEDMSREHADYRAWLR